MAGAFSVGASLVFLRLFRVGLGVVEYFLELTGHGRHVALGAGRVRVVVLALGDVRLRLLIVVLVVHGTPPDAGRTLILMPENMTMSHFIPSAVICVTPLPHARRNRLAEVAGFRPDAQIEMLEAVGEQADRALGVLHDAAHEQRRRGAGDPAG